MVHEWTTFGAIGQGGSLALIMGGVRWPNYILRGESLIRIKANAKNC